MLIKQMDLDIDSPKSSKERSAKTIDKNKIDDGIDTAVKQNTNFREHFLNSMQVLPLEPEVKITFSSVDI